MRPLPKSYKSDLPVLDRWRGSGSPAPRLPASVAWPDLKSGQTALPSAISGPTGGLSNSGVLPTAPDDEALADLFADYIKTASSTISTIVLENEAIIVAAERSIASLERQVGDLENELATVAAEKERLARDSEQRVAALEELVWKLVAQLKIQDGQIEGANAGLRSLANEVSGPLTDALSEAHISLHKDSAYRDESRFVA